MISFRLLTPLPTAQRSHVVIVYKAAWVTVGAGVVMERERLFCRGTNPVAS